MKSIAFAAALAAVRRSAIVERASLRARIAGAAAAVGMAAGCSIPVDAGAASGPANTCDASIKCGPGAACLDNACIATDIDLSGMLLEVLPNSGATFGASTSYIVDPSQAIALVGSNPAGYVGSLDVLLPSLVSTTTGTTSVTVTDCAVSTDGSFPAKIDFTRVASQFLGFPTKTYSVISAPQSTLALAPFVFSIDVPPGIYDVYIQPIPVTGCEASTPPPFYYPNQKIDDTASFAWSIDKPSHLVGDIKVPDGGDLDGWLLDVVEPDDGHIVSTPQTLSQQGLALYVDIDVNVFWPDKTVARYVRLRPPSGVTAPSVYWGLAQSAKPGATADTYEVHYNVDDLVIKPRSVEVQVRDGPGAGVVSSVEIQSVTLSGNAAANAAYAVTIPQTAPDGTFTVPLPPGDYRVRATPLANPDLALGEQSLSVPAVAQAIQNGPSPDCVCGQTITLNPKAVLSGTVSLPDGAPAFGTPITTAPSQIEAVSFWQVVHALDPTLPRAGASSSNQTGAFSLLIDPGASDVTVTPADGSNFPWLVRPRVTLQPTDASLTLTSMQISYPVLLSGRILAPGGAPIGGTAVGAWIPVPDPSAADGLAGTVIQIATTTADADGTYTLVLPSSM